MYVTMIYELSRLGYKKLWFEKFYAIDDVN